MTELTPAETSWMDVHPGKLTGLENKAPIMRQGAFMGKDRIWWSTGDYIYFRRSRANPAILQRHITFLGKGDYKFVETQGDVEIYEIQEQSQFKTKRELDIGRLNNYNLRRQATLAACKRQWKNFLDIVSYMRERIAARYRSPGRSDMTPLAENIYAEEYLAIMEAIAMRRGPNPAEINRELAALMANSASAKSRIISLG